MYPNTYQTSAEDVVARLPTLGYAILAALAREPLTGYELARRMRGVLAYFWTAPHSQIYPQLRSLEGSGLVTSAARAGRGPRPTRTYAPTAAGRAALAAWVTEPPMSPLVRDELTLKAYASFAADPGAAAEAFRGQLDEHRLRLAEYQQVEAQMRTRYGQALHDPAEPVFGNWSALQRGIGAEEDFLRWCGWMVERLTAAARGETGPETPAATQN